MLLTTATVLVETQDILITRYANEGESSIEIAASVHNRTDLHLETWSNFVLTVCYPEHVMMLMRSFGLLAQQLVHFCKANKQNCMDWKAHRLSACYIQTWTKQKGLT